MGSNDQYHQLTDVTDGDAALEDYDYDANDNRLSAVTMDGNRLRRDENYNSYGQNTEPGGKTKAGAGFPVGLAGESRPDVAVKPVKGRSGSELASQETNMPA